MCPRERVRRSHEIGDVGGESGVGELAAAAAEPGEVEAERGDAELGQRPGDMDRRAHILAAGEAVGEDRIGRGIALGQLEPPGQPVPTGTREVEPLAAHEPSDP